MIHAMKIQKNRIIIKNNKLIIKWKKIIIKKRRVIPLLNKQNLPYKNLMLIKVNQN